MRESGRSTLVVLRAILTLSGKRQRAKHLFVHRPSMKIKSEFGSTLAGYLIVTSQTGQYARIGAKLKSRRRKEV